jgi:hypothetical protein
MRLINVMTLELKEFFGPDIPKYAILSHTWDEDEVSLQEFQNPSDKTYEKLGYQKILKAVEIANFDGHEWIWIDTCCIDKTSSLELSEAINSMYKWYGQSQICYAYISDGETESFESCSMPVNSRWFTRGWTLQELIAPPQVTFLSKEWLKVADKSSHLQVLNERTGIHIAALENSDLSHFSIAQRMSWAAHRQTTREEDLAYCLIGLFNVNMPLLYGEGGTKAFIRLQEEIMKASDDHSLFAWEHPRILECSREAVPWGSVYSSLLAPSPSCFRRAGYYTPQLRPSSDLPYVMTNKGIHIWLLARNIGEDMYLVAFDCAPSEPFEFQPAILMQRLHSKEFIRQSYGIIHHPVTLDSHWKPEEMYIKQNNTEYTAPKPFVQIFERLSQEARQIRDYVTRVDTANQTSWYEIRFSSWFHAEICITVRLCDLVSYIQVPGEGPLPIASPFAVKDCSASIKGVPLPMQPVRLVKRQQIYVTQWHIKGDTIPLLMTASVSKAKLSERALHVRINLIESEQHVDEFYKLNGERVLCSLPLEEEFYEEQGWTEWKERDGFYETEIWRESDEYDRTYLEGSPVYRRSPSPF